jgi:hypothetical protein
MSAIRGVRLLPQDDSEYRKHVTHHTYLAKVNSGTKIPDPRNVLTGLVERQVRDLLATHMDVLPYRVLRWEQLDAQNFYRVNYREMDGVFQSPDGVLVFLEVKASAGKSSLNSGIAQIRRTVATVKMVRPNSVGLLVVADLGEHYEDFATAAAAPLEEFFSGMNVKILAWPPEVRLERGFDGLCVSVVPDSTLCQWLPPDEEESELRDEL